MTKLKKDTYNKPGAIIIEGHIQGLSNTRSLGEAGIPVFVVDKTNCIARYSRYCNKFFRCPDFLNDEFATFLITLAQNENIKDWILLPSNDHAVFTISKHKNRLEKYYKVITPDFSIIENIYDKSRLLKLADKVGVPIPHTYYFQKVADEIPEELNYPVITKGRYGLSFYKALGKKAFMARNANELRTHLKTISVKFNINNTFTQEVIYNNLENKTISFTAFCIDGIIITYWMGVKLREHPLQFGTATFAESIYIQDCYDISKPLLKSLNYTGVCEIEYLFDPKDKTYKLIEMNARTWLWVGLAKASGIDYARIIYNFFYTKSSEYPEYYSIGIKWRNSITDTIIGILGLLKGKFTIKNYLKSFKGKITHAVFSLHDPFPSLMFLILLPFLIIKR